MIDFLTSLLPRALTPLQREAVRQVTNELDGDNTPAIPNRHGLVPVGDSGFYVTPNEPVDPWDCQAWPNSPFCDRSVASPITNDVEVGLSSNGCETCVTLQPTVLHIRGPAYTICYRRESCRPPSGPPPPISDTSEGGTAYQVPRPVALPGMCRRLYANHTITKYLQPNAWREHLQCWINKGPQTNSWFIPGMGPEGIADWVGPAPWTIENYNPSGNSTRMIWFSPNVLKICNRPDQSVVTIFTNFFWVDFHPDNPPGPEDYDPAVVQLLYDTCAPSLPDPPPAIDVYPPGDDDMGCNCGEMEELLREIYNRLGCKEFPIKVPKQLHGRSGNEIKLEDFASTFAWSAYQLDSLIGEWPVEIEIEDDDPTEEGNQVKRIDLPNISEAMAEVFGLAYKNSITTDLNAEFLIRLVAEVLSVKNAALINQDYVKANAEFLGYKGNPVRRKIDYAFDPTNLNSLEELMRSSRKEIIGWENEDKETALNYFQNLMFAAGIIKAAFMRNEKQANNWLSSIEGMILDELRKDSAWEAFLRRMENQEDPFNRSSIPKPRVNDMRSEGTDGSS